MLEIVSFALYTELENGPPKLKKNAVFVGSVAQTPDQISRLESQIDDCQQHVRVDALLFVLIDIGIDLVQSISSFPHGIVESVFDTIFRPA